MFINYEDPDIIEPLAEEVHNAWWAEKIRQGKADTHPDAIPYHQLPEEIKEYDRVTVRTVLKGLNKLMSNKLDNLP